MNEKEKHKPWKLTLRRLELIVVVYKMKKHKIKVIVSLSVDLNKLSFPTDDKGVLIWTPEQCIEDYISHNLFKEHDASYMSTLVEGIEFEGWKVEFPTDLIEKTAKIMVENFWNHPEDKRGKDLHDKYATLDDAIRAVTKEAIKAFVSG